MKKATEEKWPELAPEALHGLAGDVVSTIAPQTEADPVGLLIQFLTAIGNLIGRNAYFLVESTKHFTNLFTVIVGQTSISRKGTSLDHILRLLQPLDNGWYKDRIQSGGLSSGEGLAWTVRDSIEKKEPIKIDDKRTGEFDTVIIDHGITDKRLLVIETEFANVLKVMTREGSTLSPLIRACWDKGDLNILTKNSPAKSTNAHISIIGHVTSQELMRYLTATEAGNGYGNRHIFCSVRRSKILPEGGKLTDEDFKPLQMRLKEVVLFSKTAGQIRFNLEARELWYKEYGNLSRERSGLFGSMTARAAPQVIRLSCLYALLDQKVLIEKAHLEAALALWGYSELSSSIIFGNALGDPVADEILIALKRSPKGLTRTEIRDLFGRNKGSDQLERALTVLQNHGLASFSNHESGGRPIERWSCVAQANQ
jgi:hypothetical protein